MLDLLRAFTFRAFYGQESKEKLEALAKKYKKAMAQTFGVPEEWIRDEVVKKWALRFSLAFIRPEYWNEFLKKQGISE